MVQCPCIVLNCSLHVGWPLAVCNVTRLYACILCMQFDNRVGYQPRWDVWGRFTQVLLSEQRSLAVCWSGIRALSCLVDFLSRLLYAVHVVQSQAQLAFHQHGLRC